MNGIEYYECRIGANVLRGMIHRGTNPSPIIMVHGYFSSNKIGPHRLYYQIAQALNQLGYTVLRVDFSGMGESDGDIKNIHFSNHVSDLLSVIDDVVWRKELCSSGKVHLLAHCIGCCTALTAAHSRMGNVESITLMSPFYPSEYNHRKMLGEECFLAISKNGSGYRNGAYCCKSFVDAAYILTEPVMLELLRMIPANLVISECDDFVALEELITWSDTVPIIGKVIAEANHNYIGPEVRKRLIEHLLCVF